MKKKRCYECKQIKSIKDFSKSKNRKDGRSALCKECRKKYWKEYYPKNRDRLLKYRLMRQGSVSKKIHIQVLQKISGLEKPMCVNCGCDDLRLLEINHLNGGGHRELKKFTGITFYRYILMGKRKTDDLNILCRMCNALYYIKMKYGDIPMKITWERR